MNRPLSSFLFIQYFCYWGSYKIEQSVVNPNFYIVSLVLLIAHRAPITSAISHILSITAPLSHTCTTYRPVVLIKKTTDISSEKVNKCLVSHFRPQGERVQMNKWSVSSLSHHLHNVTYHVHSLVSVVKAFSKS